MSDTITTGKTIGGQAIQPVDEQDSFINVLIYANPGTGKTVLSGSAANVIEMSPVLLIDVEGGTLSLKDFYPDVDVVRVTSWKGLQKIYDELYKGKSEYRTVIIDSLTELQKFNMQEVLKSAEGEKGYDPDVPRMRDWGRSIEQIRRLVRAFRDLPINVIFTALANSDKDSRGKTEVKPSFPGKLAAEIPAFVDIVLYYYIKEQAGVHKRLLISSSTEGIMAKDRSNRLPLIIENPTMETLYGLITGEISKEDIEKSK